jgi:hypothetical protein
MRVVAELRVHHPSVFNLYFDDLLLRDVAIEEAADFREAPSLDRLAECLRARAGTHTDWLVATPIANLSLQEVSVLLAEDALLCRAPPDRDWER